MTIAHDGYLRHLAGLDSAGLEAEIRQEYDAFYRPTIKEDKHQATTRLLLIRDYCRRSGRAELFDRVAKECAAKYRPATKEG
jgi:hypothetical protein